jgi:hypothetical protein
MRNLALLVAALLFGTAGYGNTSALLHITATPQSQVTVPAGSRILVRMVVSSTRLRIKPVTNSRRRWKPI